MGIIMDAQRGRYADTKGKMPKNIQTDANSFSHRMTSLLSKPS